MKSIQILTVFALVLSSNSVCAEENATDEAASLRYDEYILSVGECENHYHRMIQRTPDYVSLSVKKCLIPNWLGEQTGAYPHYDPNEEEFWIYDVKDRCEERRLNLVAQKSLIDPCIEAIRAYNSSN